MWKTHGETLGKGSANAGFSTFFSTRLRRRVSQFHMGCLFDGVPFTFRKHQPFLDVLEALGEAFFLWWTAGSSMTQKWGDTSGYHVGSCWSFAVLSCFIPTWSQFSGRRTMGTATLKFSHPQIKKLASPVQRAQVASYVVTSGIIPLQSRMDQAPVCE